MSNYTNRELRQLMEKYLRGDASIEEAAFVEEYYAYFDKDIYDPEVLLPEEHKALGEMIFSKLSRRIGQQSGSVEDFRLDNQPGTRSSVNRVHILKTIWFRYAAAILLIVGVGSYLWISNKKNNQQSLVKNNKPLPVNVAPGTNKAMLSLADGTIIVLDSAGNGTLAQQGDASIVKLSNGQIVYKTKGSTTNEVMMNTMSTPKGGQYQLTLPDGSRVWLNAASSISYPAAFVGKDRKVKVTGEAYFEVAKNKQKPFIVDINGKSLAEVLGTSFNINSYSDEESIKTTLLEGSLKVIQGATTAVEASSQGQIKSGQALDRPGVQCVVLKSGQQVQVGPDGIAVSSNADIEKALAWKNGLFNFNGANLYTVMRQLERWYDIEVRYEGPASNIVFKGKMYRNVNLSDVLEVLQKLGVKFRMDRKVLTVY